MTLVLGKDHQMSEIKDEIILRGLKENNLKNIDLNIQRKKSSYLLVFQAQERAQLFLIHWQQKVEGK